MKDSLTPRLLAAAELVRDNRVVVDVGTDHAYLPIYLVQKGICKRAIATDINEGPIERANENIRRAGLEDAIIALLTDGLNGTDEYMPQDVVICGMGGELICKILRECSYIKNTKIRLILQPMTAAPELYIWLHAEGFSVTEERFAREGSRYYRILCAEYVGECSDISLVSAYIGSGNMTEERLEYIRLCLSTLERRIAGNKVAGNDTGVLSALRDEIREIISND